MRLQYPPRVNETHPALNLVRDVSINHGLKQSISDDELPER